MDIKYKDIPEQEIVNLIAWFAREKGKEIIIHVEDGTQFFIYEHDLQYWKKMIL